MCLKILQTMDNYILDSLYNYLCESLVYFMCKIYDEKKKKF